MVAKYSLRPYPSAKPFFHRYPTAWLIGLGALALAFGMLLGAALMCAIMKILSLRGSPGGAREQDEVEMKLISIR